MSMMLPLYNSCWFGALNIQLSTPNQPCLLALLDNGIKEATEEFDSIAGPNTCQTRMVWQWLSQVISQVPADAEPVGCHLHQLPFRTNSLKKHHQLQLEEDHRVDRRTTSVSIDVLGKCPYK